LDVDPVLKWVDNDSAKYLIKFDKATLGDTAMGCDTESN
jgi:hypothetical protein